MFVGLKLQALYTSNVEIYINIAKERKLLEAKVLIRKNSKNDALPTMLLLKSSMHTCTYSSFCKYLHFILNIYNEKLFKKQSNDSLLLLLIITQEKKKKLNI